MDGTRDAVLLLEMQFGQSIILVDAGIVDIAKSCRFDDVTHVETFDGFVLANTTTTIVAANCLNVATSVLRTSMIPTLDSHAGLVLVVPSVC